MVQKALLEKYRRLNGKYLTEADELLRKGDSLQAGEKFWGAAAEIVKAIAAKRGKRLRTHNQLWEYVLQFDKEHPDLGIRADFAAAGYLHANFYEEDLSNSVVEALAQNVRSFIGKMEKFL